MGCMKLGIQPAFLAYSTFFNISAASGAKQKSAGCGYVFFNKKGVERVKKRERDREESSDEEEEKGTKASKRIEAKAWKESKILPG